MLSTKPISEVTWDDIENFCRKQYSESTNLEYKEAFPERLDKTLAAMANTFGGTVLIGVKENKESKPELPLIGIEFVKGLEEKVYQTIVDNIKPTFFPEVRAVLNQAGDRAVVIIRIPQSKQAPHAISRNTRVYIRTGNISTPEDLMDIDLIGKFLDRNKEAEQRKKGLYTQSIRRYQFFQEKLIATPESFSSTLAEIDKGAFVRVFLCPSFPFDKLTTPCELRLKVKDIQVRDSYGTDDKLPKSTLLTDNPGGILVQDGTILLQHAKYSKTSYCELNIFGSYFVEYPFGENPQTKTIRISELLIRTHDLLSSAIKFYYSLGYWGSVDIEIMLGNLNNKRFIPDWYKWPIECKKYSPDDEITCKASYSVSELSSRLKEIHFSLLQSLLWGIDFELDQGIIDTIWKKL